jgi:flagellar L-ring protein precursor FlgH
MRIAILLSLLLTASVTATAQKKELNRKEDKKTGKTKKGEVQTEPPVQLFPPPPPPQTALTGSLFNVNSNQMMTNLFNDPKARCVGDILTISVLESTKTSIDATSTSSRKSESTFGIPNAGGLGAKFISPYLAAATGDKIFDGTGQHTYDGTGTVARNSAFSTTIAARVREVLPNGDLVVEATKEVLINREKQTMTLTGIVRSYDISPNNIVSSSFVADLKVNLSGKGFVADANRPGWLFTILQKISPF